MALAAATEGEAEEGTCGVLEGGEGVTGPGDFGRASLTGGTGSCCCC